MRDFIHQAIAELKKEIFQNRESVDSGTRPDVGHYWGGFNKEATEWSIFRGWSSAVYPSNSVSRVMSVRDDPPDFCFIHRNRRIGCEVTALFDEKLREREQRVRNGKAKPQMRYLNPSFATFDCWRNKIRERCSKKIHQHSQKPSEILDSYDELHVVIAIDDAWDFNVELVEYDWTRLDYGELGPVTHAWLLLPPNPGSGSTKERAIPLFARPESS